MIRTARWGILISGRGSNLQSLLDWDDRIEIVTVVSSKEKASGLRKAYAWGVKFLAVLRNPVQWGQLDECLLQKGVNKIFLLGFMKLIPEKFVNDWKGHIYNVHPSMLPLHPGVSGLEDGWKNQSPLGVTVHHVISEMDSGAKVFQGSYSTKKADWEKIQRRNAWMERRLISEVVCR